MKKIITASVALLSVITLAACSGKTTSDSSEKASSSVEKTSTSKSKSSSSETSSKTASSDAEIPEIVLLTDEEIDNAKTIGDMKALFSKLIDNYKKYINEIGAKVPEAGKEAYNQQVEPAIQSMETSRETFNETLSSVGSDDTEVPEQNRALFAQQLKTGRDTMKKAIEGAYKALAPLTSAQ